MKIYKSTAMIVAMCAAFSGLHTKDYSLVFNTLFFSMIIIEIFNIKDSIKNIGPWY